MRNRHLSFSGLRECHSHLRRKPIAFLEAFVAATVCLFGIGTPPLAAAPLVAAYGFNESSGTTAADGSGNDHPGTLTNGSSWTSGRNSGGIGFDGVDDFVSIGDVAQAEHLGGITVSAWVKFTVGGGGTAEVHLVDKSHCSGYPGAGPWELGVALTSAHKAEFVLYPQNGAPAAFLFSGPSATSVDDGAWHYVAGRYDGINISIWVDGTHENSRTASGVTLSSTSYNVELGGHCNGYSYPFKGTLDDVRIYSAALSTAEIRSDMATPVGSAGEPPPVTDTSSPSQPTNLTATNVSTSSVSMTWSPSSDNVSVTGYRVYRDGTLRATRATADFGDTGLTANTSYSYTVSAFDAAGNLSPQSAPLIVTTPSGADTKPPSTPTGLSSSKVTSSEVTLSWQASTDNVGVAGYRVFRNGTRVATISSTAFTSTGLTPNTSYSFRVAAFDAAGNGSPQSAPLAVTTAASSASASYATNFDANENPISEGGVWHRANNQWTNVQTIGGVAFGTNGVRNTYDDSYALLSGFGRDQTAEAVVYRDPALSPGSSHEVELLLRASDDASNARGYECLFNHDGGVQLVRWNGAMGDYTVLPTIDYRNLGRPLVTGDVIKATIVGNEIRVYINDILMGRAIDSTFSTGQPGISFFVRPDGSQRLLGLTSYRVTSP